jgi:hypothetical protein
VGKEPRAQINPQAAEFLHRPEFLAPFVRAGFNSYFPAWDTGVDFLLIKEFPNDRSNADICLKVQLKSRWNIQKKYLGRKIWIALPEYPFEGNQALSIGKSRDWYLVPHDLMVLQALQKHGASESFKGGDYSKKAVPEYFKQQNAKFEVTRLIAHVAKTNEINSLDCSPLLHWPIRA